MGLLERVADERKNITLGGGQGFSEPPLWALERMRYGGWMSSLTPDRERIENDFEGYVEGAYKADGIVFACILARQLAFSEARFQWRQLRNGRPGDMFGNSDLALLEEPWPGGTTGELLARMEAVSSLAGNHYATTADDAGRLGRAATGPGRRIVEMRPDRVTIIIASASGDPYALDARPVGYMFEPLSAILSGTARSDTVVLLPNEVSHYSPIPDPIARFRGMSWLTPVLREISADRAATTHKLNFFENGATLNAVASLPKEISVEAFKEFVAEFNRSHQGTDNAYKTLFLGGGADVKVVGADLKQLDFKATQGASETRIAAAARVHPVILGISEGLAGSSLNAGNYGQARRNFADGTMRPLWRIASASLQRLLTPPAGAHLWYDDRDIAFLREDEMDQAEILSRRMLTIESGVRAGYTPESVVAAVVADDLTLMDHTGLFSVQLQPPMTEQPALARPVDQRQRPGPRGGLTPWTPSGSATSRSRTRPRASSPR